MSLRPLFPLSALLLTGCLYHTREATDEAVRELAARPFDLAPAAPSEPAKPSPAKANEAAPAKEAEASPAASMDLQTTAFMQAQQADQKGQKLLEERLKILPDIPASEIRLPNFEKLTKEQIREEVQKLYPPLPPVPDEPRAQPGPGGKPYTLADLQQIAAANSPQLRQAASDVQAAWGALIQARAYPNPKIIYSAAPSSDGSTTGVHALSIDQVVSTGGKIKLAAAAAEMDLRNAELALRRARSDLATAVRNAYFALLVAKETVVVNKAMAKFTDNVYGVQRDTSETGLGATYEPAALRAMAYQARLGLKVSIDTYIYSWKQLASTVGLRQLPLTEVAGRIDAAIPYYDFDAVRDYVLRNHTDVLTARNAIDKARYNLKLAQVTPVPDVEFAVGLQKDFAVPPFGTTPLATVSWTLPVWDQNKGNIMAAEAALVRASEEPHRVEVTLSTNLAAAYLTYKTTIDSVEYYRRYILPDQMRAYLGTRTRFFSAPPATAGVTFGDVVSSQQTLATSIGTYLTLLGSLWSSAVGVADFLQTDDLFQLARPLGVERVPQLDLLPPWPCGHPASPLLPGTGPADHLDTSPQRKQASDTSPQRKQGSESVGLKDSAGPTVPAPSDPPNQSLQSPVPAVPKTPAEQTGS